MLLLQLALFRVQVCMAIMASFLWESLTHTLKTNHSTHVIGQ